MTTLNELIQACEDRTRLLKKLREEHGGEILAVQRQQNDWRRHGHAYAGPCAGFLVEGRVDQYGFIPEDVVHSRGGYNKDHREDVLLHLPLITALLLQ